MLAPNRFGDPQPIEGEQADERVVAGAGETSGDQHRSDLVAVQARGAGLVVEAWPAHVHRRRGRDHAFLFGVPVEAGDGAQPPGDRCTRFAERLEVPTEGLDVGAARTEQPHAPFRAPGDVLAQIQRVRLTGQAAIASQEADERKLLFRAEQTGTHRNRGRDGLGLHVGTSSIQLRPDRRDRPEPQH
jgi:hypothetical protein